MRECPKPAGNHECHVPETSPEDNHSTNRPHGVDVGTMGLDIGEANRFRFYNAI